MSKGIIYLQKEQFDLYLNDQQKIFTCQFTKDLVNYMEVINKEAFENLITSFITTNKLQPANLIIVLANSIVFTKEITNPQPTPNDAKSAPDKLKLIAEEKATKDREGLLIQQFIDNIPFAEVSHKIISLPTGKKVIAANTDLYDRIKNVFAKSGFIIEAVAPIAVLDASISAQPNFSLQMGQLMLGKYDILRQNSLVVNYQNELIKSGNKNKHAVGKSTNKRAFILSGVLGLLLLVLGVMVYMTYFASQTTSKKPLPGALTPASASPTGLPVASGSAQVIPDNSGVTIIATEGEDSLSTTLRENLTSLGFTNVSSVSSGLTSIPRTTISFTSSTSADVKVKIVNAVQALSPEAVVAPDINSSGITINLSNK